MGKIIYLDLFWSLQSSKKAMRVADTFYLLIHCFYLDFVTY